MNKFNIDRQNLENDPEFQNLKSSYEDVEKKLLDPDFFFMTLGDNFNELPKKE